jgi:hypothetical protein
MLLHHKRLISVADNTIEETTMRFPVTHIVLMSGGLASFEAGRRVLERFGKQDVRFWFFDTLIEDEDLYRFLQDSEAYLGVEVERFVEGRHIWEVFHDKRYIGNSRVDLCSRILKREYLERLLAEQYREKAVVLYMGLEWTEEPRIERVKSEWKKKGYHVEFPLRWEPLLFPGDFYDLVCEAGVSPPRLYNLGFPHNNCGGACVKAGIKQWSLLWRTFPDRFLWHEKQEDQVRRYLHKDVSILRDRRGGKMQPLTLEALRLRLERKVAESGDIDGYIDSMPNDFACSCFIPSRQLSDD